LFLNASRFVRAEREAFVLLIATIMRADGDIRKKEGEPIPSIARLMPGAFPVMPSPGLPSYPADLAARTITWAREQWIMFPSKKRAAMENGAVFCIGQNLT
jgi:hypothetical protein